MEETVMVGMSGGVDSSVAAALLSKQGYKVVGVTLKLWDEPEDDTPGYKKTCCSLEDVNDARKAAAKLKIPFYALNFKDLFEEKVVNYFIDSYMEGLTPNPCIACNKHIKFQTMMHKARAFGMDYMATGHYARIKYDPQKERFLLKKGADDKKDQSYVLYMLNQQQLKKMKFPLGNLKKEEVRKIADEMNLNVSDKPDSQDICFVGNGKYTDFIREYSDQDIKPGPFKDTSGKVLGTHNGLINYTVGQRKGLGMSFGKRMYVIDKRKEDNTVVLGSKEDSYSKSLIASKMNYIPYDTPPEKIRGKVKLRYNAKGTDATVTPIENHKAKIEFDYPQSFITPGQAAVIYDDDLVIGGGTIEKSGEMI